MSDRARRISHEALIDALLIAVRNIGHFVRESGHTWLIGNNVVLELVESAKRARENEQDRFARDKVAHAAIDFVWQVLDEEETLGEVPMEIEKTGVIQ